MIKKWSLTFHFGVLVINFENLSLFILLRIGLKLNLCKTSDRASLQFVNPLVCVSSILAPLSSILNLSVVLLKIHILETIEELIIGIRKIFVPLVQLH